MSYFDPHNIAAYNQNYKYQKKGQTIQKRPTNIPENFMHVSERDKQKWFNYLRSINYHGLQSYVEGYNIQYYKTIKNFKLNTPNLKNILQEENQIIRVSFATVVKPEGGGIYLGFARDENWGHINLTWASNFILFCFVENGQILYYVLGKNINSVNISQNSIIRGEGSGFADVIDTLLDDEYKDFVVVKSCSVYVLPKIVDFNV